MNERVVNGLNLMSWYFSDEVTEASGRFCAQDHLAGLSQLTREAPLMLYVAPSKCSANGWNNMRIHELG